ncbi:MAG: efflux RND transporter permease subunit [Chloroflexi bacterium]|nr:efflux RND transporter permease subunit [Chloroflexota bacterium]
MRSFFDAVTRFSLRFRWITLLISAVLVAVGVFAATQLNIALIPSVDFPSTFILARSHGGTSGDLMLQTYSIPIEQAADTVEGVINHESSTTTGFAFLQIRNEFGLDMTDLRAELRAALDTVELPVRTLTAPEGTSPAEMIAALPPDVVLYLQVRSLDEGISFLPQLSREVWLSFSPEVLGALPEGTLDEIDPILAGELRVKAVGEPQPLPDLAQTEPPGLPESWQADRFETAADLAELTGVRTMAEILNAFMTSGEIAGPLMYVSDLTEADLELIKAVSESCRTFNQTENGDGEDAAEEAAICSMLTYLDGDALAALITHFDLADGDLAAALGLPADYFDQLGQEDRSQLATGVIASLLSDESAPRDVLLPPEWRLEPPRLITFSLADIPLGIISISADESELSREELRQLVENEVIPQLEALDAVADVAAQGGERIRPDLLNAALAAEGLDERIPEDEVASTAEADTGEADAMAEEPAGESEAAPVQREEGPALPASWRAFATSLPGVEELDTADDLLQIQGMPPSALLNQAVTMAAENEAVAMFVNRALTDLSPEVLLYLAEHEEGFFDNLALEVLQALAPETLSALPDDVQERASAEPAPPLSEFWQRLGRKPELGGAGLTTAADLLVLDGGPASVLNRIVIEAPDVVRFYAVQLVNSLSPDAISYLAANDADFLGDLDPLAYCYFSVEALNLEDVRAVWSDQDWVCGETPLLDIAEGHAPSAVQTLNSGTEQAEERVHDPDAPALPASWSGIASFVGAQELNTADDLFYATGSNGEYLTPSALLNSFASPDGAPFVRALTAAPLLYVADCDQGQLCEKGFFDNLTDELLLLLADEAAAGLPDSVQSRRETARRGIYTPVDSVTRTNGQNSLLLNIVQEGDANTVSAWGDVEGVLHDLETRHPEIDFEVAFEQASYIEESINGVAREGGLGAVMAVIVILIFLHFSIRSTLVTAISIPTSVALAFILMKWVPGNVHDLLYPLSQDATGVAASILTFILRLFPEDVSLNIMTLSGLTVAIGRIVDDSIVVLENIYRNIQAGENRREAILHGTRDVSVAIFAATITTVVVFLPIGLFGGVIGAFFLPFGLAVTYALLSSFVIAITVVPVLAYLFITKESLPEEHHSRMEDVYRGALQWALAHRWVIIAVATITFLAGMWLLTQLPTAFLPAFGEPSITVTVSLPGAIDGQPTTIAVTDAKVRRLENYVRDLEGVETIQTQVGGGGQESVFVSSTTISQTEATLTIGVEDADALERLTPEVRREAERIFNDLDRDGTPDESQTNVTVSGASLSEQGFGGFAVVVSGDPKDPPPLAELEQYDEQIVATLESIEGITNVESSLGLVSGSGGDVSQTYIRIDGIPAARYTAELETEDTLGLTQDAIAEVRKLDLPANVVVSEGFESQQQTEGFQQTFISMGIAVVIVYFVMLLTFGSLVHPITILFSLPLAAVGAAVGLAVTGRVLGLSSVVGLLMLVGIVVTNAIVLIDRVQTNRKMRGMGVEQALLDGGTTRLRPILMTAIATMVALLPLAIGLSEGAIIAAELGTVVIGGLFSSTLLTLLVVPVVYSLFDQAQRAVARRLR